MPSLVGQEIGEIGYGLMGLTWRPTPPSEEQAFAAMKASLAAGNITWNAGDFYGTPGYNSLHILNRYFTKYPEDASKVVLSIKSGLKNWQPDGSPENIKDSIDYCMSILDGKKSIDIYEMARVDKNTPIEITMKALNEHIKLGNIKGIGLSEASEATIREAAKYAKIVAVEAELSLWSTDILTNGVASTCAELDIPIIAYSPIGRGMLTGEIKKPEDIEAGDFRHTVPRFSKENFPTNLKLVAELQTLAKAKGFSPAQLAIGWVKYLSKRDGNPEFIPIPGATTAARVQENLTVVNLTSSDIASINSILQEFEIAGDRYDSHGLAMAHV